MQLNSSSFNLFPIGYPIGNKLNELLLSCTGDKFSFHTSGVLVVSKDGTKPDFGYQTSQDLEFEFCRDLIQHFYKAKGYFDYEEFYDFFTYDAKNDVSVEALFKKKNYGTERDVRQMLYAIQKIYIQLISYYLVDKDKNSWYDNADHMGGPYFPGYTGILNCLKKMGEETIVNVHTLNHDLFFERLNHTDWISGELSDGFKELGSPYFGQLDVNGRSYPCRLERYTGIYDKKFRLFKLHGSKDYGIFYESGEGSHLTPEKYIKTRQEIGFGELYKETVNKDGKLFYDNCWVNYHADFLTGTTSKIERYKEPLLFKILFEHFKNNLNSADKLIIIGYGGKDSEVNRMLYEYFGYKNKPCFIVDPYPGDKVIELKDTLGATLVTKQLEDIGLKDLNI